MIISSHEVNAQTSISLELTSLSSRPKVVELFTSEGCSSCPPADKFISQLTNHQQLWKTIFPLVWHVDYWDWIGWRDPFAKAENSLRQRQYKQQASIKSVYTPGFVINGEEWRGFFYKQSLPPSSKHEIGELSVAIKDNVINAQFKPLKKISANRWTLNIALLGMNIQQAITRGENKGKTLSHNFVVRHHQQITNSDSRWHAKLDSSINNIINTPSSAQHAIVVWLSIDEKLTPVQAVASFL